jgi:hypothetical protein
VAEEAQTLAVDLSDGPASVQLLLLEGAHHSILGRPIEAIRRFEAAIQSTAADGEVRLVLAAIRLIAHELALLGKLPQACEILSYEAAVRSRIGSGLTPKEASELDSTLEITGKQVPYTGDPEIRGAIERTLTITAAVR